MPSACPLTIRFSGQTTSERTRDGGWWMVQIPKLGERTQARYPREVELMAREYIAISTGTPIDQVVVSWRRRTL
jgi:hypothetical protein